MALTPEAHLVVGDLVYTPFQGQTWEAWARAFQPFQITIIKKPENSVNIRGGGHTGTHSHSCYPLTIFKRIPEDKLWF